MLRNGRVQQLRSVRRISQSKGHSCRNITPIRGNSQVYIPKRRTLIQLLPPANAYTKLFATCSCIFSYPFVVHSYIYAIRPVCIHSWHAGSPKYFRGTNHAIRALFACNLSYMHEQITKEFERRKYLYECTPFGYLSLWVLGKLWIKLQSFPD